MSNGGRELQQYNYCHCNRQGKRRKKQRRTNTLGGARGEIGSVSRYIQGPESFTVIRAGTT